MTKQKRLAKVEIVTNWPNGIDPVSHWCLIGGNGQIICHSETFARRADAKRAMRRAIQIIQSGLFRIEE